MKKAIWKYGLIAGGTLIVLAGIFLVLFLNRKVTVPEVTGKKKSEAIALLADAKLQAQIREEYSDTIEKEFVISQDIADGTKAEKDTLVTLVVSKGKEQVTLPDVKGSSAEEAKAALEQLGFSVVEKEDFHDTIPKGSVISQSVRAGKQADKGATITIYISKGPDIVVVPDIQGMTVEEAQQAMRAAGLYLEVSMQFTDKIKEGELFDQSVAANEQVKRNTSVSVKVSAGVANKVGTTQSNASSFGKATSQGDWIYFAGDDGIYRMRKDKSMTQRICDTGGAVSLNVVAEWLYYTARGGIYKIKIDGTGKTQLNKVTSYKVYVEGEWIYYTSKYWGGQIYKMKTDGSAVTQITKESCTEYIVNGEYIYFVKDMDGVVYKCGTDGKGTTVLCPGFSGANLALVDNRLVVSSGSKIKRVNLDGSGFTTFGSNQKTQFYLLNSNGGWIYYLECDYTATEANTAYFGRIKADGSEKTKIYTFEFMNHSNTFLNVLDGWIYFQNEKDGDLLYRVNLDGTKVERMG